VRHKLQSSRFELKYVVDEPTVKGIRDFVRPYLELDDYARPEMGNMYPIHSLYLDSPTLTLYRQTLQGLKNRFKLRIRFYDDNENGPAFMEIKRRVTNVIRKERAGITREAVRRFLRGQRPDEAQIVTDNGDAKSGSALQQFCNLSDDIRAGAAIYVSYLREAHVSPNSDQIRLTFDREIEGYPFDREVGFGMPPQGARLNVRRTVLEMKFTDRFPPWMGDLVQAFNLQKVSFAKYNRCIEAVRKKLGEIDLARGLVR